MPNSEVFLSSVKEIGQGRSQRSGKGRYQVQKSNRQRHKGANKGNAFRRATKPGLVL